MNSSPKKLDLQSSAPVLSSFPVGADSATAAATATASSPPPPPPPPPPVQMSATRVEVLQRTLHLLRQEVLVPYYELVERLRVTNNRAVRIQDIVETLHQVSFTRGGADV